MKKLSDETVSKILELYSQYGNGARVSKELGITLHMIYKYLRANGIEPKKNGSWQQKIDIQYMINLYQSGKSLPQIARITNLNDSSVYERLKNAGIILRSKSEALNLLGYKRRGPDEEIIKLYKGGMNAMEIARQYGLKDQKTILEVLHKHNIKIEIHGERSPNWKGGKLPLNKLIRNCAKYINWRNEIFKERDYTCEVTGERGGQLNVHHKKPLAELIDDFITKYPEGFNSQEEQLMAIELFSPFWDKSNVVVLTEGAHKQLHSISVSSNE